MSRKDYVLIAQAIRDQVDLFTEPDDTMALFGVHAVALRLADALERDNRHFDRERFLLAALGEGLHV